MRITLEIATLGGWVTVVADAPDGSDVECYALPKSADRLAFWEEKIGQPLPRGSAFIWTT